LKVLLDEFLLPGRWELLNAPELAEARGEGQATALEIVLRRSDVPPSGASASGAPASTPSASATPRNRLAPPQETPAPLPVAPMPDTATVSPANSGATSLVSSQPVETVDLDREILAPHRIPAHFAWGSRHIQPSARAGLDSLATRLVETPELLVEIQGHADATGSRRANMVLSRARAQQVRRFLISRGVPPERIRIRGLGATTPVGDNRTAAGRSLNRRVELHGATD
jgi:outer membrane protein OmpA-like peptidoglycan-associated protein